MATFKITQLSKDFNLKSKDITDIFAKELKIEKKSGATVDSDEFDLFIQKLTLKNQIKNLDSYLDGTSSIKKASEAKPRSRKSLRLKLR